MLDTPLINERMSRRQILGAGAAAMLLPGASTIQAEETPLNRFPRMMQEYFVRQVRAIEGRQDAVRNAIRDASSAQAYVDSVRERIGQCFGPQPERTPLRARITGVLKRDAYRIEKLIFESRPGFQVTANLYLPADTSSPRPAVVGTCGHSANGKAAAAYQSFAQGLARLGYVCLIYDPIGQGERLQYVTEAGKPRYGSGVVEHLLAGNQQYLVNEFLGAWRAWDGIRALDYLLERPEVDPKHLGVTGNSGGGTMTTWLCGVESRWTMAAPACFVTTFRRNLENELPADTEQCPPRALALGLDHSDFLAALAPKPIVILAQEKDYFDARGASEAYNRLKRLYTALGQPDNIKLHIGGDYHGYSQENRVAMYRWFNRATGNDPLVDEPQLSLEEDADLQCSRTGQVSSEGSQTVFYFTSRKATALAKRRDRLNADKLADAIRRVLRVRPLADSPPDYRILRYLNARKYPLPYALAYAVETEPGIQALVYRLSSERWMSRPPKSDRPALLYLSDRSSDAELRGDTFAREQVSHAQTHDIYSCDVRGTGESQPDTCGINSFLSRYGSDYFYAAHSLMLNRPYPGQKTYDVLRVLRWLKSLGHPEIRLVSQGRGISHTLFAAALDNNVNKVVLRGPVKTYHELATTEDYEVPLSQIVPGVLSRLDLSDCLRILGQRVEIRSADA